MIELCLAYSPNDSNPSDNHFLICFHNFPTVRIALFSLRKKFSIFTYDFFVVLESFYVQKLL